MLKRERSGFTLIEMLVVIGIITVLVGASVGAYSKMTKSADKAKAQELVSNVATAMSVYFQQHGYWPKALISGDGRLNAKQALVLAKTKCLSLSTDNNTTPKDATKLTGIDQLGVVTPWAAAVIKRTKSPTLSTSVPGTKYATTIENHILYYAIDVDGDGIIEGSELKNIDGVNRIRATAAVWCIGKTGGNHGQPWPYAQGRKRDDVYSWTYGQTQN